MKLTSKCNLMFISFYLLLYPTLIMFSTYLALKGTSTDQIALFLALSGILTIIVKPFLGAIIDKGKCRLSVFVLCLIILLGNTLFFYLTENEFLQGLFYIAFISVPILGIMDNIDSWTVKLSVEYPELDYPKHRSCGSLSFACISIIFGFLLARLGLDFAPIAIYILVIVFLIFTLQMPDPSSITQKKEKVSIQDIKNLFSNHQYVIFVIMFAFGCGLVDLADNYLGIIMLEKGGTTAFTGTYDFIKASLEFLVMYGASKLLLRYGTKHILMISYFGIVLKNVLAAIMPTPLLVVCTSVSQVIGFPLLIPAKMEMMKKLIPAQSIALAMAILGIFQSLFVSLVYNPMISLLSHSMSTSAAFALVSCLGLVSIIGTLFFQKKM